MLTLHMFHFYSFSRNKPKLNPLNQNTINFESGLESNGEPTLELLSLSQHFIDVWGLVLFMTLLGLYVF